MLQVVVRIAGFVGIPRSGKQFTLSGDGAALHTDAAHETMFEPGSSPVTAPDQSAALRELTQKGEVAFPAGFAAD